VRAACRRILTIRRATLFVNQTGEWRKSIGEERVAILKAYVSFISPDAAMEYMSSERRAPSFLYPLFARFTERPRMLAAARLLADKLTEIPEIHNGGGRHLCFASPREGA
jgi:hypothetical protein